MERDEDFTEYVGGRWPVLVRSAVLLGCGLHEAEDLVQTALARCYTAWPKVAAADNRDAYVYRVLVNCQRDSRRRFWWREQPTERLPERPTDADGSEQVDVTDAVERALANLSEPNRAVVVLRYYAQLSEKQTAEALGVPQGTVKSRLSRALAELAGSEHLADLPDGNA